MGWRRERNWKLTFSAWRSAGGRNATYLLPNQQSPYLHYTNSRDSARPKTMGKPRLRLVTPATVKRTVTFKRPPNRDLRSREYLTEGEVERLMRAPKLTATGSATRPCYWLPTGMACVRPSWLTFAEIRSISELEICTFGALSLARRAPTPSSATNCVRCGGCSASKNRNLRSCSRQSAVRRSRRLGSHAWLSVPVLRPSFLSRVTRTCCGTHADMRSPTKDMIPARCRPISDTQHSAHSSLYGIGADAVQGFLAEVKCVASVR